jgi:hypothetical protein
MLSMAALCGLDPGTAANAVARTRIREPVMAASYHALARIIHERAVSHRISPDALAP